MNNEIEIFKNEIINAELRVRRQGDTFIVRASDIAPALNYRNLSQMIDHVPAGQSMGILEYVSLGNGATTEREVTYLTEGAFYRVVGQRQAARIKDPQVREAVEKFQDWVFNDVLVTLRRDGVKVDEKSDRTDDEIRAAVERQLEMREYKVVIRDTIGSFDDGDRWMFADIRDRFLYHVSGLTAGQLRTSGREIRTWTGKTGPTKRDLEVGSNYLTPEELKEFNMLLDYVAIEVRRSEPRTFDQLIAACEKAVQRKEL